MADASPRSGIDGSDMSGNFGCADGGDVEKDVEIDHTGASPEYFLSYTTVPCLTAND